MEEILPRVWHWTTFHEGIRQDVHSYYLADTIPPVVIDPRIPDEGLSWFERHAPPRHVYLTNRHHYRHSDRFAERFGATVWCHRDGLHEFTEGQEVRPFEHGEELPGGLRALRVAAICPEETALYIPREGGILSVADAVIRVEGELAFVPDSLLGGDPEGVKAGIREAFRNIVASWDFAHLLLAHGEPVIGGAPEALRAWLDGPEGGA